MEQYWFTILFAALAAMFAFGYFRMKDRYENLLESDQEQI